MWLPPNKANYVHYGQRWYIYRTLWPLKIPPSQSHYKTHLKSRTVRTTVWCSKKRLEKWRIHGPETRPPVQKNCAYCVILRKGHELDLQVWETILLGFCCPKGLGINFPCKSKGILFLQEAIGNTDASSYTANTSTMTHILCVLVQQLCDAFGKGFVLSF